MSINTLMSKNWAFIVIALFIFGSFTPSISGYNNKADSFESVNVQDETTLKCYALGRYGVEETEITLSFEEAEHVYNKLRKFQVEINLNPFSENAQKAKVEYIDLLAEKDLIHHSLTKNDYISLLNPQWHNQWKNIPINDLPKNGGTASSFICSVTSGGMGNLLPPFLLPRPRMGLLWLGRGVYDAAATAVGSLLLSKGFTAIGEQTGIALGFMGVGLTYGSPVGPIYGLAGYTLFVTVNAEYIETFPPNFPPEISDENPRTGSSNIPVSFSELNFRINDPNGDRMSYSVTTDPYIGSGSGNMKGNGVYTIPVSNLQGSTEYKWYVSVSDGQYTTEKTFSFTTVFESPIISNPNPSDRAYDIPVSLSELSFTLSDPQNDLMDYTVTTQPDIGSTSVQGVSSGSYSMNVNGLQHNTLYTWTVSATDGIHSSSATYTFKTAVEPFDPFEEGWQYRKKITIDHDKVTGGLSNFPVLVNVVDSDLRYKAQSDGDDILFMNGEGIANKLFHEIESYDSGIGKLVAWVNVPILSPMVDTVLYLYYGNPNSGSQQFPEKVWDSNYLAVFHMNDDDNEITDSTLNSNDFSEFGNPLYLQNGKIGYGIKGDGNNDYFTNTIMDLSSLSEMTIELWFNIGNIDNEHSSFLFSSQYSTHDDIRFAFSKQESGMGFQTVWDDGTIEGGHDYTHLWNLGDWKYVVGSIKNNEKAIQYVNGAQTIVDNSVNFDFMGLNGIHSIGCRSLGTYRHYYDGIIDEVRISDVTRSAEWISTSYNNQNNPSSFLSFGPEETGP